MGMIGGYLVHVGVNLPDANEREGSDRLDDRAEGAAGGDESCQIDVRLAVLLDHARLDLQGRCVQETGGLARASG